ncbi:MAG: excinuclease ABC subunit UvrC [Sphingobacteriia bacterium]|nr:excinuclease ABC subunit UvrC [Sphingobacteriia bacterium]
MNLKSFELVSDIAKKLPPKPGVYRMIDANSKILYVGKARNLKKRVSNYASPLRLNNRLIRMVEQIVNIEVIVTASEAEALLLEASLIKSLKPKYNILLRDDKSFPYIFIRTDHEFPQVVKYRGQKKEEGLYFGPFASARDVNNAINELQKIFLLRPCSDNYFSGRKRPCLEYQIKRCSAPCVNFISKDEYNTSVKAAHEFLKGNTKGLLDDLIKQMEEASKIEDYEKAAWLRDRIKALNYVQSRNRLQLAGESDVDVIALYRVNKQACIQIFFFRGGQNYGNKAFFPSHAEDCSNPEIMGAFIGQFYQDRISPPSIWLNEELEEADELSSVLSQLANHKVKITVPKRGEPEKIVKLAYENAQSALMQRISQEEKNESLFREIENNFNLPRTIKRIEVYDNSHISGTNAVGAMIVAGINGFIKNEYKKYNIKTNTSTTGGDDYQMLREVLTRRIRRLINNNPEYTEEIWPDLMLIDGGKGQATIVEEVMQSYKLNIPYVCIAKGKDRNAGNERFFNKSLDGISFDKSSDMMKFLQILRDEAHRFAIGSHRKRRSMAIGKSKLDEIPGIGPKRKKDLLNYFGSYDALKNSGLEDIEKVPGINKIIAKQIHDYLHQ